MDVLPLFFLPATTPRAKPHRRANSCADSQFFVVKKWPITHVTVVFIKCELKMLPTRSSGPWVRSVHHSTPVAPVIVLGGFRFTFYCLCAHMVISLWTRLYCHYHHHVAINTPSHISFQRYECTCYIYHSTRFPIFIQSCFSAFFLGWVRNCFGTCTRLYVHCTYMNVAAICPPWWLPLHNVNTYICTCNIHTCNIRCSKALTH